MFYFEESCEGIQHVVGVLTDWDLAEQQTAEYSEVQEDSDELRRRTGADADTTETTETTGSGGGLAPLLEIPEEGYEEEGMDAAMALESKKRQKALYRTGTGPFMACDLLHPSRVPPHEYRHDLESFFWVLVWFCCVFNPEKPTKLGVVSAWQSTNLVNVGQAKGEFLRNMDVYHKVLATIHPTFQRFVKKWIFWMHDLFRDALALSSAEFEAVSHYATTLHDVDSSDAKRERVLAKDLKKWNESRRQLRNLVTFDAFMEILETVL